MEQVTPSGATPHEPKTPFAFLVDSKLATEKSTTRTKVRQSHLENNGVTDPYTDRVLKLLESTEETIDGWITQELLKHPAYPWFSRVKGLGNENIAKVVGLININKAPAISSLWKFAGMHVVNRTISPRQQLDEIQMSVDALQAKLNKLRREEERTLGQPEPEEDTQKVLTPEVIGELISSIDAKLNNELQPLTRGTAPHPETGKKLDYCKDLRVMCFRLAGSLLKAQGKYAKYYNREKQKLVTRYQAEGKVIVPTLELPKHKGKIFEPVNTIAAGHVHMQAMRKMIKLFLSHLWLVWREAEGLPVTQPHSFAVLGHAQHNYISPEEMCDKPVKKTRARKQ